MLSQDNLKKRIDIHFHNYYANYILTISLSFSNQFTKPKPIS